MYRMKERAAPSRRPGSAWVADGGLLHDVLHDILAHGGGARQGADGGRANEGGPGGAHARAGCGGAREWKVAALELKEAAR